MTHRNKAPRLTRRRFLGISGGLLYGLSMNTAAFSLATRALQTAPTPKGEVAAVFQDMPFRDFSTRGDRYRAPGKNQATVDYVNSLSEEAFLRRHWFA